MPPELEIRPDEGLAVAGGHALALSARELALMVALADRAGHVVGREELCRAVWQRDLRPGDRSIDVYVHKLRVKLEQAVPGLLCIHTHVGFGYRLDPVPSHPLHTSATAR